MFGGNNWKDDSKFTAESNLYWSEAGVPDFYGKPFAEWQAGGRDQNSLIADPGFVDAAARDFRLKPNSPALRIGFEPLDLGTAGLHGPEAWRNLPKGIKHREVEVAPPDPTLGGPFVDDFEEYELGAMPDGGVPPEGGASVVVTDHEPAQGRQCLVFTDAPGVTAWKPHWFVRREPKAGTVRMSCAFRLDPDQTAQADLEIRDWQMGGGNAKYTTGPLLRFFADGSVKATTGASWTPLTAFPPGTWVRVVIEFEEGEGKPKTYTARLGPLGGDMSEWPDLPFRHDDFTSCTWVGFAGMSELPGRFYVDDFRLE